MKKQEKEKGKQKANPDTQDKKDFDEWKVSPEGRQGQASEGTANHHKKIKIMLTIPEFTCKAHQADWLIKNKSLLLAQKKSDHQAGRCIQLPPSASSLMMTRQL